MESMSSGDLTSHPQGFIPTKAYTKTCWWCGDTAGTREHRFKRSDMVQQFGRGPYRGSEALVRGVGGKLFDVQGPNSKHLKFEASLCHFCNTTRSQNFDRAHERFIAYISRNAEALLTSNEIDFHDVYGQAWREHQKDFVRYLVKHVACRLAGTNIEVGRELIGFLTQSYPLRGFTVNFEVREDILALMTEIGSGSLWLGGLSCEVHEPTGAVRNLRSHYGYDWLRISWLHDLRIPPWSGWSRRVSLARAPSVPTA